MPLLFCVYETASTNSFGRVLALLGVRFVPTVFWGHLAAATVTKSGHFGGLEHSLSTWTCHPHPLDLLHIMAKMSTSTTPVVYTVTGRVRVFGRGQ
jgi:hypothetical protein